MRSEGLYSTSPLDEIINPGGRIVAPEACKRFMLKLHELPEPQLLGALERLATAFRASPHNRHACAGPAGMVNDLLHLLPNYQGAARERVLELLRLLGCPVVLAPCEAEASCAALCQAGRVYATATEDMDALTFGSPVMLKNLFDTESSRTQARARP